MTVSPVLLLIFNRPGTTALVMEAIRAARPPRLYVAADGPRDRAGEVELCEKTRAIATAVDWPCQVLTQFRERNLGCREVSGAITWFFEHEAEGIILEDDCLPSQSFFQFCDELLSRFRDDERVMCIAGTNFQDSMGEYPYSYYFSKYSHIWGWASWRRAWRLYDADMVLYSDFRDAASLEAMSLSAGFPGFWRDLFDPVLARKVDVWSLQWLFSCWAQNGVTATPRVNLVSNIGFGPGAAHTTDLSSPLAKRAVSPLAFPLRHPAVLAPNQIFDAFNERAVFGIGAGRPKTGFRSMPVRAIRKAFRLFRVRFGRATKPAEGNSTA